MHVADRDTMPGKKFWTWGNGPDGRMWDHILTDEDGPYIELMTGGYSDNQPDYSWIQPGESRTVVHYWYPVRELGGIKAANLEGALDLEVKDGQARLAANTTTPRRDARVRLTEAGRVVFETTATIAPDAPFVREVALPAGVREEGLRLAVLAADGKELVAYESRLRAKAAEPKRYVPPPAPAKIATVEELVSRGNAPRAVPQRRTSTPSPTTGRRSAATPATRARTRRSGCSRSAGAGSRRPRSASAPPSPA